MATVASYGGWKSPITVSDVARHDGRPNWVGFVGDEVWWTEPRPSEGGRVSLVRRRAAGPRELVLPRPWSVRSRVIEYGGRAWTAVPGSRGPLLVFSEFSDQRLYALEPDVGDEPRPISPLPVREAGVRYAEPLVIGGPAARDTVLGEHVLCVRETHTGDAPTDVVRELVAIPLDGRAATDPAAVRVLVRDRRFVTCPRLSPDHGMISWIAWDHPDMPWDATELRVASLRSDGTLGTPMTLAGGRPAPGADAEPVSVAQAEWLDARTLCAAIDSSGWWNLCRVELPAGFDTTDSPQKASATNATITPLCSREEEFAGPIWNVGQNWFAPIADARVAVLHGKGRLELAVLDLVAHAPGERPSASLRPVETAYTEWAPTLAVSADGHRLAAIAASPARPYEVVVIDTATGAVEPVRPADPGVDETYLPRPEARVFPGPGGREVYANLYPPSNPDYEAPEGELPPYVVFVHGGPTSRAPMVYDLEIAFFTSRGIGVVEVNYGGSTGFGRAYRDRLRDAWGVVDVQDCAAVARALATQGLADPQRIAIRGGSAGGWTSAASITDPEVAGVYRCAAIRYPILDLAGWRTGETHDFESRYLESLVGPWPAERERYEQRSPVERVEHITVPFVLLQGLDDRICPPVQSERFLAKLAGRGVRHAYLTFEGEQHGFRKESTIEASLRAELSLYAQTFGFDADVPTLELTA